MPAFADAVVKTILERHLPEGVPVYTILPAHPARKHVYATTVGGVDVDPRFRLTRASVQIYSVALDYLEAYELAECVHRVLMEAERTNESTPWGYVSRIYSWETAQRHSKQRAPADEWRFLSFYGVLIS